jgi:hypothetical protein
VTVFHEERMPAITLIGGLLEVCVDWRDAAAGIELATDRNCGHAFGVDLFEDDRVLGEAIERGRIDPLAPIGFEVVCAEGVGDKHDN